MPSSVIDLVSMFELNYLKSIKWGTSFLEERNGIYIISTSKSKEYLPASNQNISINDHQIDIWLSNAPNILLNKQKPSKPELKRLLNGFWLPDETILYIGKAEKQTLSERVCQFYNHKVGKKSPHKGGYWLKLLNNLSELYIHLFSTRDSHRIEEELLKRFIENVSKSTKQNLKDKELCLPFANLQLRSGVIKNHGLNNHYQ